MRNVLKNIEIPRIGMRILKSAIAVLLCFVVDYFRKGAGIVFYSQLSALWCMQATRELTIKNAKQRMIGTFIGTFYGFLYIVLRQICKIKPWGYDYLGSVVISGMVILVIYTAVFIKKKQASLCIRLFVRVADCLGYRFNDGKLFPGYLSIPFSAGYSGIFPFDSW
ncbi:MAG: FUSC family protein [Pseudobutyrivibrio sp.]|nr:FUSC family protein [Pseudobutyrivibrio sp.]